MLFGEGAHITGHPSSKGDIVVGNDVWIGYQSCILSGVTIGNGAIIGARSVITKDVPPYAIVAGNPAKFVRYRFPQETIDKLESLAWWDWDISVIKGAIPLLLQQNRRIFHLARKESMIMQKEHPSLTGCSFCIYFLYLQAYHTENIEKESSLNN